MAYLDDLGEPLPIREFITRVVQTIHPKKEFASIASKMGGSPMSRYDDLFQASARARGRSPPSVNAARFFSDNANIGGAETAWTSIQNDRAATAVGVQTMSGHSPSELADMFGFDVDVDWPRYRDQNMSFEQMTLDVEARYPRNDAPGTTPAAAAAPASGAAAAGAGAGTTVTPEINKATGVDKQSNTGGTAEERAAAAKAAHDAGLKNKDTPEGMAWWKKAIAGTSFAGLVAGVAVAAVLGKALDEYLASDGAEINFIHIKTKGGISTLVFTPKEVDVDWTGKKVGPKAGPAAKTSSIVLCATDAIEFHNSTLVKVEEVSSGVNPTSVDDRKSKFAVDTLTGDSSGIDLSNTGYGVVHTNFDAHVASVLARAATGFGRAAGSTVKDFFGAFGGIGGVFIGVFGIIIAFMLITGLMSLMSKSDTH
jgi:hypothetical protein